MDKLKKLNGSMIAAIVLSVLLIMSVTAGATLAWFASRDTAVNSLVMGEAVIVTIGEDYRQGDGEIAMTLPVPEGQGLLPGMSVTPNIRVHLQQSNTNALVRARFITTAMYPDNYEDAAYSDHAKYPDATAEITTKQTSKEFEGRVLDKDLYEFDHVYAGTIHYDYYDAIGRLIETAGPDGKLGTSDDTVFANQSAANQHTVTRYMKRVKVRKALVDMLTANKAAGTEGTKQTWPINGKNIEVKEDNIAELEIRQRGVDLTDAINRVLAGQRGYGIDPETGEPMLSNKVGTKYTRRVADGWAYRAADQAWYYMGSQTNGKYMIKKVGEEGTNPTYTPAEGTNPGSYTAPDSDTSGKFTEDDLVVGTATAAKDIIAYTNTPSGNVTVQLPTYKRWVASEANGVLTNGTDKTRNYLGGSAADNAMDNVANEIAVLNNTKMASVDLSGGNVQIDFLTKRFVLPTFINNDYAKAEISFKFTVEAVQDYLVDPLQEATSAADRLPNNLVNAIIVFNNAFPQAFENQADDNAALAATGAVTNVVPGGGVPSSVVWYNQAGTDEGGASHAAGTTSLEFHNAAENDADGKAYGYGRLKDVTIQGTPYTYDDPRTVATDTNGTATVVLKYFQTRVDEYGDTVADYTAAPKQSSSENKYQRGTASANGLVPATGAGFSNVIEGDTSITEKTYTYEGAAS